MRRDLQSLESSLIGVHSLGLKLLVWAVALVAAALLAMLRVVTGAEFAFMSAVIFPVIAVAWVGGGRQGVFFATAAALFWVMADLATGRIISETWVPVLNGLTRFAVYSLVAGLVGLLRKSLQRERRLARHDMLTGLMNRRSFLQVGQEETARARRYGHPMAVAFLDLDNFKQLNDTRGHDIGDAALKQVAQTMVSATRATDRPARLGGDEFAIILPETDFKAAQDAGNKLADAINAALKKEYSPASVSVGVASFDVAAERFEQMVKAADALMYEIKNTGKRGVRFRHIANLPSDTFGATPQ